MAETNADAISIATSPDGSAEATITAGSSAAGMESAARGDVNAIATANSASVAGSESDMYDSGAAGASAGGTGRDRLAAEQLQSVEAMLGRRLDPVQADVVLSHLQEHQDLMEKVCVCSAYLVCFSRTDRVNAM